MRLLPFSKSNPFLFRKYKNIVAAILLFPSLNEWFFVIKYKRFAANYFLHYSLIKYYQNDFDYLDFNGVVGDFTHDNPYTGLNKFK